jgi:hypothetical protein
VLFIWSYRRNFVSAAKIEIRGILNRIQEASVRTTEFFKRAVELRQMHFYNSLVAMLTGSGQNVGILSGGCEELAPFVSCRDSTRSLKYVV